jgi:hypothetical protein
MIFIVKIKVLNNKVVIVSLLFMVKKKSNFGDDRYILIYFKYLKKNDFILLFKLTYF